MKKILTTGALLSIITPVAMTVSCGSKDTTNAGGLQSSVQFIKLHQDDMLKRHCSTIYSQITSYHYNVIPPLRSYHTVLEDGANAPQYISDAIESGDIFGHVYNSHVHASTILFLNKGFDSFNYSNEVETFNLNDVPSTDMQINVDDIEQITATNTKRSFDVFWEGNTLIKQAHATKSTSSGNEVLRSYNITLPKESLKTVDFWIEDYQIHSKSSQYIIHAYRKSSFIKLFNKVHSIIGSAPSTWAAEIEDSNYMEDTNYKTTSVNESDMNKWLIYGEQTWMPHMNSYSYIIDDSVLDRLVS